MPSKVLFGATTTTKEKYDTRKRREPLEHEKQKDMQ